MFEDKSGFFPEEWKDVYELLKYYEDNNLYPDPNWDMKTESGGPIK